MGEQKLARNSDFRSQIDSWNLQFANDLDQAFSCVFLSDHQIEQAFLSRRLFRDGTDTGIHRVPSQGQRVKSNLPSDSGKILNGRWAGEGDDIHPGFQCGETARLRLDWQCLVDSNFMRNAASFKDRFG